VGRQKPRQTKFIGMGFFGTEAGQGAIASSISSVLGLGVAAFGSKQQRDLAREQANNAKEIADRQLQVAQINQQTALAQLQGAKEGDGKSNLPLYIGLGVGGVLVLGLVIFAVTRK
jgi:uncharacterized protein HemX